MMKRCIGVLSLILVCGCESLIEDLGLGPILGESADLTLVLTSAPVDPAAALQAPNISEAGGVPLGAVESINVTVHGVQVRAADGGAWLGVDPASDEPIDLMNLSAAGVVLASGELPSGEYVDARLFVDDAGLVLNQEVCLEGSGGTTEPVCLAAGTAHEVFIPSGQDTGIKTDARFELLDGGSAEVGLVFEPEATVLGIAWAPELGIVLAPVIRAAGDPGGMGSE